MLVLAAALCLGSTFPVTKQALGDAGPFAVVALRFLVGGLVLLPFAWRRPRAAGEPVAFAWCSIALFAGYALLTVGLRETTSTAAAFICYLLVVIVPAMSAVLLGRLPTRPVAAGVLLAAAGLFLLAGDGLRLGTGELLVLGSAFAFAAHILLLDHFVEGTNGAREAGVGRASGQSPRELNRGPVSPADGIDVVRLAAFQLVAVGLVAVAPAAAAGEFSGLSAGSVAACLFLAAAGVGGLLLQMAGQRSVGPTRTSLLLMLEPVLAAVGGYAIGERIAPLGFLGAALILVGILLSELPLDRPVNDDR